MNLFEIGGWTLFSGLLGWSGYRKGSLSGSGAVTAGVVGVLLGGVGGTHFGLSMLAFYISASKLTKLGMNRKSKLLDEVTSETTKEGRTKLSVQRSATQVLCNSAVGVAAALYAVHQGVSAPTLSSTVTRYEPGYVAELVCLSFFSACSGDTWASEVGVILPAGPTVLVTKPWKLVLPGTNGGVSLGGTLASWLGGAFVGGMYGLYTVVVWSVTRNVSVTSLDLVAPLLIGSAAGLFGSLLDSILGAMLQFSGVTSEGKVTNETNKSVKTIQGRTLLSNNQVNVIASTVASIVVGYVSARFFS